MKRKGVTISVVVAVVVLGFLTVSFFYDREPRYQGRTLSEWIMYSGPDPGPITSEWIKDGDVWRSPRWQAASHAVRQMAPEAIPFLLKWVQVKPSPIVSKLAGWLGKHPSLYFRFPSMEAQIKAFNGFDLLRNDARPAWPKLIALTYDKDPERRYWAFNCLVYSRPDKETLGPVLLRLINDSDPDIRYFAAWAFHDGYSQDAEKAGVYKIFPSLKQFQTNTILANQRTLK